MTSPHETVGACGQRRGGPMGTGQGMRQEGKNRKL